MRNSTRLLIVTVGIVGLMGGCSLFRDPKPMRVRPAFSPNGELLHPGGRGAPPCATLVGAWWDKLAARQAGQIDKAAFLADAERQFAVMDLDHDGFITSNELSEYRTGMDEAMREDVPAIGPDGRPLSDRVIPPPEARRTGRTGDNSMLSRNPTRYGSQIPADMVDPVMSADRSLSFKVSHEDFMVQANEIFAELDKDHDGKLSRDEATASCPRFP